MICNWKGECITDGESLPVMDEAEEELTAQRSPLLGLALQDVDNSVQLRTGLLPVSLLEESFKESFYTTARIWMYNFISQSVLAGMECRMSLPPWTNSELDVIQSAAQSEKICIMFKTACTQAFNFRMKMTNDILFRSLGYALQIKKRLRSHEESLMKIESRKWKSTQNDVWVDWEWWPTYITIVCQIVLSVFWFHSSHQFCKAAADW